MPQRSHWQLISTVCLFKCTRSLKKKTSHISIQQIQLYQQRCEEVTEFTNRSFRSSCRIDCKLLKRLLKTKQSSRQVPSSISQLLRRQPFKTKFNELFHGIFRVADVALGDVVVVVEAVFVQIHLSQEGAWTKGAHDLNIFVGMVLQEVP